LIALISTPDSAQVGLGLDPDFAAAHQGMARILSDAGEESAADEHWRRGFAGHATIRRPYRGRGVGISLLMLVSARGGNIPSELWITQKHFELNVIYADFYDDAIALPQHSLVVNLIGDADACRPALERAQGIAARCASAPICTIRCCCAGRAFTPDAIFRMSRIAIA
jgi:hypothetical protein